MSSPDQILKDFLNNSSSEIVYIDVDGKKDYKIDPETFKKTVISLANFFYKNLNLKKGDTVSYVFENCPEVLAINLACFFSGLRSCPLDSKRDTKEVALKKMEETQTKVFFHRKGLNEGFATSLDIKTFSIAGFYDLASIVLNNTDEGVLQNFDPNAISLILYTSGTTGFPKGAELSFSNLFYGAKQVGEWFKIEKDDCFYLVLPLHHINSTVFSLATLFNNGSLVISSRYSKTRFFQDAARFHATMSSIVPTINIDLLEEEESFENAKENLKFKYIQIGSAPVSSKHTQEFVEKYGIRLIQGYGSTETSLRVSGVPVDADPKLYKHLLKTNSIGQALSENEIVLFDNLGNIINEPQREGEVGVRGKNVMQGYLNREEESKKALEGGYFHTGDVAYFEEIEGKRFYFIKGRIKEIIIKGGVNISPLYVEERLREATSWSRDVVVVGFPHYRFGEEVGAVFIPKDGNYEKDFEKTWQDLKNNRIKNLSSYETPKAVILASDEEIAKTATGKVQHIKVRDEFKDKLALTYKYIGENNGYIYRVITPDEEEILNKAVEINNSVFPESLALDLKTLIHRATNGFVIGGFDSSSKLLGVLTGYFGTEDSLLSGEKWSDITDGGKFTHANPKGKVVILASAASSSSRGKNPPAGGEINNISSSLNLTEEKIKEYIASEKDFIVRFHQKPKAGFEKGANVSKIILNGNIEDKESLGTVVMFEYPSLDNLTEPKFTTEKLGVGLVEAAIKYAKDNKKEKVIALSRLGEAYKYIN